MMATSFWGADGKPITSEEFLNNLFGELPKFFKSEDELRTIWSHPMTKKTLLEKLDNAGFGKEELNTLKKLHLSHPNLQNLVKFVAIHPVHVRKK